MNAKFPKVVKLNVYRRSKLRQPYDFLKAFQYAARCQTIWRAFCFKNKHSKWCLIPGMFIPLNHIYLF